MKNKSGNKILSLALVVAMVFTLLPGVTVYAEDSGVLGTSSVITAFDALPESVAAQSVTLGTSLSALSLPETLTATITTGAGLSVETDSVKIATPTDADEQDEMSGGTLTITTQIPVTWQSEPEYDGDTAGTYTFTAAIPGEYTVEDGMEPPVITVTVGEAASAVTITIAEDENNSTALYLPEGTAITDTDLLAGVSAMDENGNPVAVTIQDADGLDMDNPQMRGTYPNLPYVITYAATHPVTEEVFTATREVYVTLGAGAIAPTTIAGAFDITGGTLDMDYTYAGNVLTITGSGTYTIGMATPGATSNADRIVVSGSITANITLNGLDIDVSGANTCAFVVTNGANVSLTLTGTNTLKSGSQKAGLEVSAGNTLTITETSTGSLAASGGYVGAGIGGGYYGSGGNTIISGGTVIATGNGGGAGIGGGYYGNGGNTIISGGTVIATGGGGAGIGGGNGGNTIISGGTVIATGNGGGAGIGGGYGSSGGTIEISGGTVTAKGGTYGAGIGGGRGGSGGTIEISGGTVTATGTYGAGIGGGDGGSGGTIEISGGTVTAISTYGAGIGGGGGIDGGSGGNTTISGGTVIATGGGYGKDIGPGSGGSDGTIIITGGSVKPTNSNVSPQPTNGSTSVYLNTLTVGSTPVTGTAITAGNVDGVAMDNTPNASSGVYGTNDVLTDSNGAVYFWLTGNGAATASVTVKANGSPYSEIYTRNADNTNAATLEQVTSASIADSSIVITQYDSYYKVEIGGTTLGSYYYSTPFTISGSSPINTVTVTADSGYNSGSDPAVGITLTDVNIDVATSTTNTCAFEIKDGANVNLTLSGNNTLKSGANRAGLQAETDNTLTITGTDTDTLTATGDSAGIGGGFYGAGGTIAISGGTVNATGGLGAGIGGGYYGAGGTIEISGGTIAANGGDDGAGIGGGRGGSGGTIAISGGTVTATGGVYGKDIGPGNNGTDGSITITGGSVNPTRGYSYVIPQPTNGSTPVYLNTLTVGNPAIADDIALSAMRFDTTESYGNTDVVTTNGGKVYVWLPQSGATASVSVTTASNASYGKIYTRDTTAQTHTLLIPATDVTFPTASAITYGQTLAASTLSGGTSGRGIFAWADGTVIPAVANSGYTVVFTPNDLTSYDYSAVTGWDGTSQTVRRTVSITVNTPVDAQTPTISPLPANASYTVGDTAMALSVTASISDGGTLSYQWYSNTANSIAGSTAVSGETADSYTPSTLAAGTLYYYVVVTNTNTGASITGSTTAVTTSNITAVTVLAPEAVTTVQIDYAAETLTGFAVLGSYTINGSSVSPDTSGKLSIDAAWMGTSVSIVKTGDGSTTGDSTAQQLSIPARPAAPAGLVGINETVTGQNDGKITGTDTAMEYSADSGASWTACTGTEITGLAPGGYLVRYKGTVASFVSTAVSVTIVSGDTPTYTLTVTAPTFSSVYTGYTRPDAKSITISNSGNSAATIASVTVSGTAFEIGGSGTAVASGGSITSWTVQPIAGLSRGTYTETITVTYNGGATATAQVSFTVNSSGGSGSSSSGDSTTYYTVTFNTNGGSSVSSQSVARNSTVTKPADPTRDGYTFTGWYTDNALTQAYSFSTKVTSGFTLYAGWQEGSNPEQPTVASTEIQASIGANGHATYTITDAMVKALIAEAQAQAKSAGKTADGIGIEVNVLFGSTAASLAITIEDKAIERLSDEGVELFAIVNPLVNFSFDGLAIKEINTQTTGTVTITVTPEEKLSSAAQAVIGSRPVYDITIKDSKGTVVSDLKKGTVTIGIVYTPNSGEKTGNLYAVYVPDSGKPELLTASSYGNGRVIFSRNTLSVYGVGYKTPTPAFTDTTGHWAKDNIDFVASRGLLTGTSDTTFSPNTAITRGMFITALGRLSGQDVSGYTSSSFSDVAAGSYYLSYIEWAVENKIVSGVGNGKFEPDRAVTREEMAVMMQNYATATGYTLPVTREAVTFADSLQISSWAADAVKALQQAGIVSGVGNNRFNPKGTATRAEAATILRNFVELVIDPGTSRGWVKNDAGQQMYYTWDGKRVTGWLTTTSGSKYYFDENGIMLTGKWVAIGGKWYYFYANGKLAVNTTIDGYEVGADGTRLE